MDGPFGLLGRRSICLADWLFGYLEALVGSVGCSVDCLVIRFGGCLVDCLVILLPGHRLGIVWSGIVRAVADRPCEPPKKGQECLKKKGKP
jgi:hypothetical protein